MIAVNIHEAKTQLSKLVDQDVKGEAFVIAKAGKPLVKVAGLDAPEAPRRFDFHDGEIVVTKDFDRIGDAETTVPFGLGVCCVAACWTRGTRNCPSPVSLRSVSMGWRTCNGIRSTGCFWSSR